MYRMNMSGAAARTGDLIKNRSTNRRNQIK